MDTLATIGLIALAIIFLLWRIYITLKRKSCCGSCGCDLMSKKDRAKLQQRKQQSADRKG